jgi:hypothetical protein
MAETALRCGDSQVGYISSPGSPSRKQPPEQSVSILLSSSTKSDFLHTFLSPGSFLAQHTFVRRMLTGPSDGGTLSGMPESLKAPAWFLKEFCLLDGFLNEDRTAIVGRCNAHMSVPLLASGVIDKPFPQATVEMEKVGEATRKRLADEGFLPAEDSTVEPWLRFVLEPAPGEEVKSPDFQSGLADLRKRLDALDDQFFF